VRIAHGLAHMGKGLVGLSRYYMDRQLLSGGLREGSVLGLMEVGVRA
jgi:hypothetical protein